MLKFYKNDIRVDRLIDFTKWTQAKVLLKNTNQTSIACLFASFFSKITTSAVFVLPDKETAAYFYNDLEEIFNEREQEYAKKKILFFPSAYRSTYQIENEDSDNIMYRTEVINRLGVSSRKVAVVTYPAAISEKLVNKAFVNKKTIKLKKDQNIMLDDLIELLNDAGFEFVDFVVEPGEFSVRGGLVDIFSFSNENPCRIEFFGDNIDSIKFFDANTQLTTQETNRINILPNVQSRDIDQDRLQFLSFIPKNTPIYIQDIYSAIEDLKIEYKKAEESLGNNEEIEDVSKLFSTPNDFLALLDDYFVLESNTNNYYKTEDIIDCQFKNQPLFNKNFDLLAENFGKYEKEDYQINIFAETSIQKDRLEKVFEDILESENKVFTKMPHIKQSSFHQGFIDDVRKQLFYTDHQLFGRYHKFELKDTNKARDAFTLKELVELKKGDFVTHIDYGIGKFGGLEVIDVNGKKQEAIRLEYRNNSQLYIGIASLHKISRYSGREGAEPQLTKLGTPNWQTTKSRAKKKVKDIARELIKLYAERKQAKGYPFTPDTYLQHELEASFIYQDTPDQESTTLAVKKDMEADYPMDRLVCGDVGFGKTEIAIRAAYKAVADSKQVAVLVPTTVLALQHFKSFVSRIGDLPCNIDYLNRFKTSKQQKEIIQKVKDGKIDILIGTHRLLSKDIEFKDLGLLVIDEEQKFGVQAKEKLRQFKVNIDTLTLTATPIPRTLQFSLMGARDMSAIQTPPPNRYPVETVLQHFSEAVIRDAINYEVTRGGQVFFVHNRVKNIQEVADMLKRYCPDVSIRIGHGQMNGPDLEKLMIDFIDGKFDVLVSTTIIEAGLDIPNANTILINNAQNFGLSDLHQLRGRVGRANRKAFCYLIAPPAATLTDIARKRLRAIEQFSSLGSGINIAMKDLDIRGAGNVIGAEQSGFITDIGFDAFQKILDEAVRELKRQEFSDVFEAKEHKIDAKNVQIETDAEVMIPDEYVYNSGERLVLYRELENLRNEEDIEKYLSKMKDRFGPIPKSLQNLMNIVRIKWLAADLYIEQVIYKKGRFIAKFITDKNSKFYESSTFDSVTRFAIKNQNRCMFKEDDNALKLTVVDVKSVGEVLNMLRSL